MLAIADHAVALGISAALAASGVVADRYVAPSTDRLVANEFAYWHRGDPKARRSPQWEMTSGSLFSRGGSFWTGRPNSCGGGKTSPNADSSNCTGSAVFRLNTRRRYSGDVTLSVQVKQLEDLHDARCEENDSCWHGMHLWLRYKSQYDLYYASINRADGHVVIKRKVPCGSDNSGTYVPLTRYIPHDFRTGVWNGYTATVRTARDGAVVIELFDQGKREPIAVGIDRGGKNPNWSPRCTTPGHYPSASYPPIRSAGAVGIRGDFANFEFRDFEVRKR